MVGQSQLADGSRLFLAGRRSHFRCIAGNLDAQEAQAAKAGQGAQAANERRRLVTQLVVWSRRRQGLSAENEIIMLLFHSRICLTLLALRVMLST